MGRCDTDREGRPIEAYGSPRWTQEIPDCSVPMTFDQYSRCSFGCLYCFAQYQKAIGKSKDTYMSGRIKEIRPERVKRIFTNPETSQFGPYVKARTMMQWGGPGDPFCNLEKTRGIGLEMLRFFREIEYPLTFSTKGTWWTEDPRYVECFRGAKNWHVKVSIITEDEHKAKVVEPGVPTPEERLEAIERIAGWGTPVTLRLRPFIIGISSPGHRRLIAAAAKAGAESVSTEFFCLETRSRVLLRRLDIMSKVAGLDLRGFYRATSSGSGYLRMSRKAKEPYVLDMKQECEKQGIRLHVSDAHWKDAGENGCCCGMSEKLPWSRGQFTEAMALCKRNGTVRWGEIATALEYAKTFKWESAHGYNTTSCERRASFIGMSMFDYLRWMWNNPKAGQSPYTMFGGVMRPEGKDRKGNLIYHYSGGEK